MTSRIFALTLLAVLLIPAAGAFAATGVSADGILAQAVNAASGSFSGKGLALMGGLLGIGLIVIGAGKGIGMIGSHAMDAIARQPEAVGDIRNNMIVAAALIEGVALIGAIFCLLPLFVFN
jgi:F-type H+-transporting ATPase subunit c